MVITVLGMKCCFITVLGMKLPEVACCVSRCRNGGDGVAGQVVDGALAYVRQQGCPQADHRSRLISCQEKFQKTAPTAEPP